MLTHDHDCVPTPTFHFHSVRASVKRVTSLLNNIKAASDDLNSTEHFQITIAVRRRRTVEYSMAPPRHTDLALYKQFPSPTTSQAMRFFGTSQGINAC